MSNKIENVRKELESIGEEYLHDQLENYCDGEFGDDFEEEPHFPQKIGHFKLVTSQIELDDYISQVKGVVVYNNQEEHQLAIFNFFCDFDDERVDVSNACDVINTADL